MKFMPVRYLKEGSIFFSFEANNENNSLLFKYEKVTFIKWAV